MKNQLKDIVRISEIRKLLAQRALTQAATLERRRRNMVDQASENERAAHHKAEHFIENHFATALLGKTAAVAFTELASGRRQAEYEAAAQSAKTKWLTSRLSDATHHRSSKARNLKSYDLRHNLHNDLESRANANIQNARDDAEEEEIQDILASGQTNKGISDS